MLLRMAVALLGNPSVSSIVACRRTRSPNGVAKTTAKRARPQMTASEFIFVRSGNKWCLNRESHEAFIPLAHPCGLWSRGRKKMAGSFSIQENPSTFSRTPVPSLVWVGGEVFGGKERTKERGRNPFHALLNSPKLASWPTPLPPWDITQFYGWVDGSTTHTVYYAHTWWSFLLIFIHIVYKLFFSDFFSFTAKTKTKKSNSPTHPFLAIVKVTSIIAMANFSLKYFLFCFV